jgi:cyclopropane fatty-acyl-phospholipid synthase-like methyltransferase
MTTVARPAHHHAEQVRRYYDRNAVRFERHAGRTTIHRAVWGPGVNTAEDAFHSVDERILGVLRTLRPVPSVVDLGCGIGASLLYLASRMNLDGEGITISPVQAARATALIADAHPIGRVRCREGNYLALPSDLTDADLAFSIEAFVHSPDPRAYFEEAARILRPGGRLAICDDFLAPGASARTGRAARWLDEFRRGWHVGSLVTVADASAMAADAGLALVGDDDLTPYLELRRWRDIWVSVLVGAGRFLPLDGAYWHALLGGNALQRALGNGTLHHRFLVFERRL